eukprot:TRINITY_DN5351_c0_g1_i3.p1 TRINITY_DN5351_c0_g1~~TRINITY_DN5351_c0_g1_i3.p1  ORF type:complete len:131 (-),score=16.86 TRINITY_DN5351_c0_g1_i3:79-471(-)
MWFAALSNINHQPWLISLLGRLFSNSDSVIALLEKNPFEERPPEMIRIIKYKYFFTHNKDQVNWWKREMDSIYLSTIKRNDHVLVKYLKESGYRPITNKKFEIHPWQSIPIVKIVISFIIINFTACLLLK